MGFVALNGYDVEKASQYLVYENIFPEIQHINGKGVTDKYTTSDSVRDVTYIDVERVLPYAPRFRQLGATNNGGFHNAKNAGGYNNAPQSTHYTIPVDLWYDEGVPITNAQEYANPDKLKGIIMAQLVKTAGMSINIVTYAKQLLGFFRQGDNFDKDKAGTAGSIAETNITQDEVDNAVFQGDPGESASSATSLVSAFLDANANLSEGVPEVGAYVVPVNERQAFITSKFNRIMKGQYMQNASEASARILATGFINPFNGSSDKRIDERTGLCGMYDGVDMFLWNKVTKKFTYVALGIAGTSDDSAGNLPTVRGYLDQIECMLVYGAGTCRGIVGPRVEANANPYFGGVYILPQLKMGVEVLHGGTIKLIVNAGASLASKWTKSIVAMIMNTIAFTPIDGVSVTGASVVSGFNDGTTN